MAPRPFHPRPGRPRDPELAAAVDITRALTRRRFLQRSGLGLGAALLAPNLLAACSTPGSGDFTFSNWAAYIDEDDSGSNTGKGTTLSNFEKETGIKVRYLTDFNDNDAYFNKSFSPLLGRGKKINADLTAPTYWMAARLKKLGWLDEIDLANVPNHKNLEDAYTNLAWDPGAHYFMPWQAGIAGIAYNPKLTGRKLTSANDLFDPKFKGQVSMLTEMRDSVGLTMFGMGKSVAEANPDDINDAMDKIEKAKQDGQIVHFTGNEYLQGLESQDYAVCVAWSGDVYSLDPDLGIEFIVPEEGGTQWFDAMVIPKGADQKRDAETWMNYVYDPEHAAQITEWVGYVSPVKGVREVLEKAGGDSAEVAENPLVFIDDAVQKRLQVFGDLEQQDEIDIQSRFNDITG
ncbi:spermidine/putrescine ABC transporter substrate-binding protein [Aquihabitans sp. G128]|uniref:ABC transporter substrate-binding protein n=1 Tax=Aquihabitans sp. G128 TaxID=2849779 RepID=UPI001C243DDC|nr:spermidine/putrescine ABC transporter substrate-binding protein [Aquihabitans sp. G128]QXC61806.1 spermidine/putrescine ABC transporter substrate-binding protein [Aquihabitans sp. G128]